VTSGAKFEFDAQLAPKSDPKLTKELGVTIRHNGQGNTVESHHLPKVQVGHMRSIIGLVAWNEVCYLRKAIHNHKDEVLVALGPWKTKYEIHAYIQPRPLRNRKWSVQTVGMRMALGPLAS